MYAIAEQTGQLGPNLRALRWVADAHAAQTGRVLPINGAGVAGAALADLGFTPAIVRGFALIARTAGMVAHLAEEMQQPIGMRLFQDVDRRAHYTSEENMDPRPTVPPFTLETAKQKVQAAEDAWNTLRPRACRAGLHRRLASGATATSSSRAATRSSPSCSASGSASSTTSCARSCGATTATASRCASSTRATTPSGQWWRSHGNEHWEFDELGLHAPPRREHQ